MRVFGYLVSSRFPFLRQGIQTRDNRCKQLHHNQRSYIGVDTHHSHTVISHRPTTKEIQHAEQLALSKKLFHGNHIYPWQWNMRNKTKNHQYTEREQQFSSYIRQTKGTPHSL